MACLADTAGINWVELFLGGLIGGGVAFGLVILVEGARAPNIYFRPYTSPVGLAWRVRWRPVHVEIENRARTLSSRFRNETMSLFATHIHFVDADGVAVIEPVAARWPTVELEPSHPREMISVYRPILPPGVKESIDIAGKFEGETSCWAFNNRSYLHSGRHPAYEIKGQLTYVCVQIHAQGSPHRSRWYQLVNPTTSVDDFCLLPVAGDEIPDGLKAWSPST